MTRELPAYLMSSSADMPRVGVTFVVWQLASYQAARTSTPGLAVSGPRGEKARNGWGTLPLSSTGPATGYPGIGAKSLFKAGANPGRRPISPLSDRTKKSKKILGHQLRLVVPRLEPGPYVLVKQTK